MGRFFLTTMIAVAEMERNLIVETQEGKVLAKQREDFREGRPRKHSKQHVQHALQLLETHTYKEVETMTGIKKTLIRRKNEQTSKDYRI